MASLGDSVYFPPLDSCLGGELRLLSWKDVYSSISQLPYGAGHNTLRRYLEDDRTVEILTNFLSPFAVPTPETRTAFETRTSAIHITPTNTGQYNVIEIKEDTLWLSKEAGIEEVAALRIVVLEWQTRSAVWLQLKFVDAETSNAGAEWDSKIFQTTLMGSKYGIRSITAVSGPEEAVNFESSQERHIRLLHIYLSERQFLYKVAEFIIFTTCCHRLPSDLSGGSQSNNEHSKETFWLEEVGRTMLKSWNLDGMATGSRHNWLVEAVMALETRMQNLGNGSGWLQDEDTVVDVEVAWCRVQVMESIHTMQIIMALVDSSPQLTRADVCRSWFKFTEDYGFFEQFDLPFQELTTIYRFPFQSLLAMVSLVMLKVPLALEILDAVSSSTTAADPSDSAPYILNEATIDQVNDVLMKAASASSCNASPAFFAWSIIMLNVREYAEEFREIRDHTQSQRALESFGVAQGSSDGSSERPMTQSQPSLHRQSSFGSDSSQQSTYLEGVLEVVKRTPFDDNPIVFLARIAVDQTRVFDIIASLAINFCTPFGSEHSGKQGLKMRMILLNLVRASLLWVEYQPEVVQATLAVLSGSETYWDTLERPSKCYDAEPAAAFLIDPDFIERVFNVALSRFPYESTPFLKLCGALATCRAILHGDGISIKSRLSNMQSFTCVLPESPGTYRLNDDQDSVFIELTRTLDMFTGQQNEIQQKSIMSAPSDSLVRASAVFQLPEGTLGRSLKDGRPQIVQWRHEYSGLRYLGRALQHAVNGISTHAGQGAGDTREVVSEIIGMLSAMLSSVSYGQMHNLKLLDAQEAARVVLEEASDGLSRNEDVITLIFDIFEAELYRNHSVSRGEEPNQLLVQCIQFTHALLAVLPGRVWPFLGRSSLLGLDGTESRLAAVVATTEMTSGRYDFLLGCVRLFDALIEDALVNVISRRKYQQITRRFDAPTSDSAVTGITELIMKNILHGLERLMVDVFESCRNWRFASIVQRLEINTRICLVFEKILSLCFELDDNPNISHKITSFLAPAAKHLVDFFLSKTTTNLPVQPLFQIFVDGLNTPSSTLSTKGSEYVTLQVEAAIRLTTTLVRVDIYLGFSTHLEDQLFKATPVLTRLYATNDKYRLPVVELFEALIRSAGTSTEQVPSMLAHMGQGTAKRFLDILSVFDQPLDNRGLVVGIWRMLSAVVSQRQQWFAIYILTGSTPRDTLKSNVGLNGSIAHQIRPMLSVAMKRLSNLEMLSSEEAISMLEFVALAADFWPWVMTEILKDSDFNRSLMEHLRRLEPSMNDVTAKLEALNADQVQIASLIVNICAMGVYQSVQTGDTSFTTKLMPYLRYLMKNGVSIPKYNVSLHSNMSKNFEARFSGYTLLNLKRTSLKRISLGKEFYYDTEVASKILEYDPSWAGKGYQEEFARANTNLSLVEAQVNLFHSWKTLLFQIIIAMKGDRLAHEALMLVVRDCLMSNLHSILPETIFKKLSQSRADLAFALLQKITEVAPDGLATREILKYAWDTLRSQSSDIGLALDSPEAEYTRTLLRILYLSLQSHISGPTSAAEEPSPDQSSSAYARTATEVALEVLAVVVAQGFRALTILLHDDPLRVLPEDFELINAILRASLRIQGVDRHPEQLVTYFTDDNTARYACTLLSWSDQLNATSNPIYGELSMVFLTELSTVPALAESMIVGGILQQISSANIMHYFCRPGGIGPFNEPTTMYNIWTRGILRLAINLLRAVGPPVAAEVGAFIGQFRGQLTRSTSSFDFKQDLAPTDPSSGYITFGMASEVHSLAIIVNILDAFKDIGASAGINASDITNLTWNRRQVKEDLETWLSVRKSLRQSIFATTEMEEAWLTQKPSNTQHAAENRLEEKVVAEMMAALAILGDVEP